MVSIFTTKDCIKRLWIYIDVKLLECIKLLPCDLIGDCTSGFHKPPDDV